MDMAATRAQPSTDDRAESGFILVPVLFTLALLALASIVLTRTVATDMKANANLLGAAEVEELSDGITRLTIRYLLSKSVDIDRLGVFRLNGTPVSCAVGNAVATISVNAVAGLIDINLGPYEVLETLFSHLGADNPKGLAAAVIDFRDGDNETTPGGAEAAEYEAAGVAHGPKNAPFVTVGELDQVLGMTPQVLALARPLVTVHSKHPLPDAALASPEVAALSLPTQLFNRSDTRPIRIRVSVRSSRNAAVSFTREAAIFLEARVPGGFLLKDWQKSEQPVDGSLNFGSAELDSCVDSVLATVN
ncbi:type II secretion system protein GspK [Hyphomicrobium sp. 99]|uniref:type II secretion system protein GspK n=1 Tax=Hyphomicrobium sp. 99 TaxID=1163419 RepID=UPI0005F78050|nr:type II secretion system protein GspK [Hyphomicrobium sp. 99]